MTTLLTIFAFAIGDESPFPVEIEDSKTVGALKEAIKQKKQPEFDHFAPDKLTLYKVALPANDLAKNAVETIQGLDSLDPMETLSDTFTSPLERRKVHIVVEPPTDKRKRSSSDAGDQGRQKIVKNIPSAPPSSITIGTIAQHVGKDNAYNRPEASCTIIPIALLHPVFAQFQKDCQDHTPEERDNKWLAQLRREMLQVYTAERQRCRQFRRIFENHTGVPLPNGTISDTPYQTDGHYAINDNFLIISEGKNEFGSLSTDPQLQLFAYYAQAVKQVPDDEAFRRSPLPCLLIYYVGSLIGFAGAVMAPGPQFEALTPLFDLATNQHDALALEPIVRALGAVRAAMISLEKYYRDLQGRQGFRLFVNPRFSNTQLSSIRHSRFPSRNYYTNDGDVTVEFDYKKRLDKAKLLFLISTKNDKQQRIVKFTQKYSKEAHAHCATHGIAPKLYAVEELGVGWMMVVMEYLDDDAYTDLRHFNASEDKRRTMVAEAVSILHKGDFVHGDIRDVNVMVKRDPALDTNNIKLVDFDWAGPDGTARYPANVNYEEIRRPQDARQGKPITKKHDNMMVEFLFSSNP